MQLKKSVEYLQEEGILFKSFDAIAPKSLGSRKRVNLYLAITLKGYYAIVIESRKKSRFLQKEVDEMRLLHERLERHVGSKIPQKYIIIHAPLCHKAQRLLIQQKWHLFHPQQSMPSCS